MLSKLLIAFSDVPEAYQLGHQDPATTIVEGMIDFHGCLLIFVTLRIGFFITVQCFLFAHITYLNNNARDW